MSNGQRARCEAVIKRERGWAAKEEQWSTCEEVIKRERERWVGKSPEEEGDRECKDNNKR